MKCEHCDATSFDEDSSVEIVEFGRGGVGALCLPCLRKWKKISWFSAEQLELECLIDDVDMLKTVMSCTGDAGLMDIVAKKRTRIQELDRIIFNKSMEFLQ